MIYLALCAVKNQNNDKEGDYAIPGNSYEPRVSHVEPGSAETLMKTAVELLRKNNEV